MCESANTVGLARDLLRTACSPAPRVVVRREPFYHVGRSIPMAMFSRAVATRSLLLLGAPALLAMAAAACGPPQPAANAAANSCNFVNYHHDEAKNAAGSGKCSNDCDCDGMRTCTSGSCTGTARPAVTGPAACNNKEYRWNEAWNTAGPGRCASDCECDGLRTCTSGACQGTAR
jgi:hypothetical protein